MSMNDDWGGNKKQKLHLVRMVLNPIFYHQAGVYPDIYTCRLAVLGTSNGAAASILDSGMRCVSADVVVCVYHV